jgi:hypothetical protein
LVRDSVHEVLAGNLAIYRHEKLELESIICLNNYISINDRESKVIVSREYMDNCQLISNCIGGFQFIRVIARGEVNSEEEEEAAGVIRLVAIRTNDSPPKLKISTLRLLA